MPKKIQQETKKNDKLRPALTPESRENQLIALAVDEAEYQLRNHTATSGVIIHYLKLATEKYKYELLKSEKECSLLSAKTDAIQNAGDSIELYNEAIKAMGIYSGESGDGGSDEEDFEF